MTPRGMNESGFQLTKLGLLPNDWSVEFFGDIFRNVKQKVVVKKNEYYQEIGIKSHGKGIFHKEPIPGEKIGNKSVYRIEYPALIFNIVFAWEQAVAVTSEQEKGMIASHRFPMYKPINQLVSLEFVKWFFLTKKGKHLLELASPGGAGRNKTLGKNELNKVPIPTPTFPEQKRIADIISEWNAAIAQTQNLLAAKQLRKKALMQQLLTGKKRLPSFDNGTIEKSGIPLGWKLLKMADVFYRVQRLASPDIADVLSITARIGFVHQNDKFSRVIAGKNLAKYTLIKHGEFAYNKGNSILYPQGCIYRLENYTQAAVPNVYFCFAPKKNMAVGGFYKYYFESGALNKHLRKYINTGVRNDGLLNLSPRDFFKVKILVPPPNEQLAIAKVLDAASDEIKLLFDELALLEKQKRGLMQKLLTGEVRVQI